MAHLVKELEACFRKFNPEDESSSRVETLAEADGVEFLCPKCFRSNKNSRVGVHTIICWFVGKVPNWLSPGPGRWIPSGTSLEDLTFVKDKDHPRCSVQLLAGCKWHGFVANGGAR